jgi:A/G-specific adenine glycosylase
MLQQTTVATVTPRFHSWMKSFPTIVDLAVAPEQRILSAWEGLGY